ncbi:DNA-binding MurR/RpiR family transcriptional regulator [Pantoea agglomerans]|uniref:MurR/RpiR family transcriptional regulator n=1 Tax=Enterobacter agglomerans TaxID=549 RepID=UPI0015FCF594|nr:MurR/RpiR family transcriptional regulator [Pantoea agglomerans]MBA8867102.1 DNA-binding MurR/RpiR family transcriptional regulator [Pantoea agglomerans]MBA8894140.1 DNA-binding MurR/RpiR family transcriptional regulator [Pantoea agglomerans]
MFNSRKLSALNALESKVHNYIIKNINAVIYMTIRELADNSGVSTATVLRFCKKMDFEGYSDLRASLKLHLQTNTTLLIPHGAEEILTFFKSIRNDDFDELISHAADHLRGAERVFFVGAGSSGTLGRYGARFFSNIGKFSNHIDDPYYPVSSDMVQSAVAVVLSVSGETPEIIKLARQFVIHKCKVISVTSNPDSTLAKLADFTISYHVSRILIENEYDITTQIPVMFILESIGRKLALNSNSGASQHVTFL